MALTPKLLQQGAGGGGPKNYIEDVFSTFLYTGNNASRSFVNDIDLSTYGGMVWRKGRAGTYSTDDHILIDTARGRTQSLFPNGTSAQIASASREITSFNTNGFTVPSGDTNGYPLNTPSTTYVSWTFRKQPKFFDIVTYSGNGTAGRLLPHSLGCEVGFAIVKRLDSGTNWEVQHRSLDLSSNKGMYLNNSDALATHNNVWNSTAATSTNLVLGSHADVNGVGGTYVAYLFAHNGGGFGLTGSDNVISCGGYTGAGSSGIDINLGYEPQWVMIKRTDVSNQWMLMDNMRGLGTAYDNALCANTNTSEAGDVSVSGAFQPTATGFRMANGNSAVNASGGTYIYIAIRRGPMKVPTDATKVFAPVLTTNDSAWTAGFPVDMFIEKWRADTTDGNYNSSRLTGARLRTQETEAEVAPGWGFFASNTQAGAVGNYGNLGQSIITHNFRRAPSFFDVVCYTGTGTDNRQVIHNLGVAPELIINKNRGANWPWWVGGSVLGSTRSGMYLNTTQAIQNNPQPNAFSTDGAPFTSSYFIVSSVSAYPPNANGYANIAYLFATLAGVSKVGSYTGTGTTLQVNCGFTGGARFVLIKRTDATGDWYVWDTVRGIVAGNDPYLLLNSTAAEVTNTDYIDSYSPGFELSSTAPAAINANGGTFIFLAIA